MLFRSCSNKDKGNGGGRHRVAVPLVETLCMDAIRVRFGGVADQGALKDGDAGVGGIGAGGHDAGSAGGAGGAGAAGIDGACDTFSAELADAAIERVTVQADGSLDIELKSEDLFAKRAQVLEVEK